MEKQHYRIRYLSGEEEGPLTYNDLRKIIISKDISGNELIQIDDSFDWIPLRLYPELNTILELKHQQAQKEEEEKTLAVEIKPRFKKKEEEFKVEKPVQKEENFFEEMPTIQGVKTEKINTLANEKTAMFQLPGQDKEVKKPNIRSIIFVALAVLLAILILLKPDDADKKKPPKFIVRMPVPAQVADPIESEKIYQEGLKTFGLDSVDGYKKSAGLMLKAVELDMSNVKALSLLASSCERFTSVPL